MSILLVLLMPLLASLIVAVALFVPSRSARAVAWMVTAALGAATVIAVLSIGLFVLPVVAALLVACAAEQTPTRSRTPVG